MPVPATPSVLLHGAAVLTPQGLRSHHAVWLRGGRIEAVLDLSRDAAPVGAERVALDGGLLAPGFVDLQVNGGGGVLFNDQPDREGLRAIAAAHRRFGTTGLMPTLITDETAVMQRAVDAVEQAVADGEPGILGIHLEGPWLNPARKGVHDADRMVTPDEGLLAWLCRPRQARLLVTLAPERVPPGTVQRLVRAGVIVCAGHTDARYEQARAALDEGLAGFTHLFNAMSPLQGRAPGVVGAALEDRGSWCGLIVDGHHVHPASLRVVLAAKGVDACVLVTDAMPVVGTDATAFMLGGRRITLREGRLGTDDGTLAGSALGMAQAVRHAHQLLRLPLDAAIRMATANPARALGLAGQLGALAPGLRADLVHLDEDLNVRRSWIGGVACEAAIDKA